MQAASTWDWTPGKKTILEDATACSSAHEWMEEPVASPDGEKLAAVVNLGDGEFTMSVNGEPWENTFEKTWSPKYSPDGRLTALVQADMAWTLAVDGEPWEESCDFIWNSAFSEDGSVIAAAIQSEGRYGWIIDGTPWENLFENANNFVLSKDGSNAAAAVQVKSLAQADVATFQAGVFSVAVNSQVWDSIFVNCWTPAFDAAAKRTACAIRLSLSDYTIAVDGKAWPEIFACVWEPAFNPATGDVVAPVRHQGAWGLAQNGKLIWAPRFFQCWRQTFSADGKVLAAIVAPSYGQFTVAVNDVAWEETLPVVTDLVVSPDGKTIAAQGSEDNENFRILVNGKAWNGAYDMAYGPVIGASGKVAARVEKNGKFTVLLDGKAYGETFERAFDPIFSPDGDKVLIRGISGGKYMRIVAETSDFKG